MKTTTLFTTREALSMLRAITIALWPVATLAAGESLGSTLGQITAADWASLILLSGVSGLVALLHRIRQSLEAAALGVQGGPTPPGVQMINWKFFCLAHMSGAMFVGALAFFVCEAGDLNNYTEAVAIALSSWSGAKIADKAADGLSDGVLARVSALFSGNKGA